MSDLIERLRAAAHSMPGEYPEDGSGPVNVCTEAADELKRLIDDAEESEELRRRMAEILSATAIALRGPPPPLTLYGWHDLTDRATAVVNCNRDAVAYGIELKIKLEKAEQEIEALRMRLAACSTVALANTPESAAAARKMSPEYWSASCADVAAAVDREMQYRAELSRLTTLRPASEHDGVTSVLWYGQIYGGSIDRTKPIRFLHASSWQKGYGCDFFAPIPDVKEAE